MITDTRVHIRESLSCCLALTILTGIFYPAAVTGIATLCFSHQANGSLLLRQGRPVGSELIGQPFDDPRYFWGRPSATSPAPYDAAASGGSNLGPLNPALQETVRARIEVLRRADPGNQQPIPVDLVTASASGLDPHISPAAAEYQVPRVARQRGLTEDAVRRLVRQCTEDRQWGLFGEPRVHVLKLNLALDAIAHSSS